MNNVKHFKHRRAINLHRKSHTAIDPHIPFTRACAIWPALAFLDGIGAPTEQFLQQSGIPPEALEQPESPIPLHLVFQFLDRAARSEGLEDIGLTIGQQSCAFELGAYGKQLRNALTVHEYLQTGLQMIGALTSGQKFWLSDEADQIRINQYLPGSHSRGRCHADIYTLTTTIRMLQSFSNRPWNPQEICLHTGSELATNKPEIFGDARILKNQAHSSFTIPKALLEQAIPSDINALQPQKRGMAPQPAMPEGLADAVSQIIASLLAEECPSIHTAAAAADMSTRTLQRRLGNLGCNYSMLLQKTRMRLAAQKLSDTRQPIFEIAASLGYRDSANFTRAFRGKTGVSPQHYRKNTCSPGAE